MSATPVMALSPSRANKFVCTFVTVPLKLLYAVLRNPEYVFLSVLAAMMFRPPDLATLPIDRIGFGLLLAVVGLRMLLRWDLVRLSAASLPMLALLSLGLWAVLSQPYDAKAWSVFAAKWIVPIFLFHIAGTVFSTNAALQKLKWFSIAVLFYLSLTAICWLAGAYALIFPKFILDEGIGIHFDRARGPFLQAVANGVCLNTLGVFALHWWERKQLGAIVAIPLLLTTPLALLATKTRAVWLAAGLSLLLVILFGTKRSRRLAVIVTLIAGLGLSAAWLADKSLANLSDRLTDRSPVEFRMQMYRAGWEMAIEKPFLGWGSEANIQPELSKRILDFRPEYYVFHNTYLELAVQHGMLGLALYAWLFFCFFRLRSRPEDGFAFGQGFDTVWRISLCIYLINASVVVMNYQFLNGYLFAIAGILATRNKALFGQGGSDAGRVSL